MTAKDVIEFEGVKIKPNKHGIYKCPFNCHRADYPQPTWKTEKGIMGHLNQCSKRPSNVKRLLENKEVEQSIFEGAKAKAMEMVNQKIGDTINYILKILYMHLHKY